MKKLINKKVLPTTLASLMLFSAVAPIAAGAKEIDDQGKEISINHEFQSFDVISLKAVERDLIKAGLTPETFAEGLAKEFEKKGIILEETEYEITPNGIKSKLAKEAAKKMINKLRSMGERAWNETIKEYVNKLPLPKSAKNFIITWTSYHVVMDALNVVVDFEGNITDALQEYFMDEFGMNEYFLGLIARALVFILL